MMEKQMRPNWVRALLNTQEESFDENFIRSIIDLLDSAALILDLSSRKILFGNSEFFKLSSNSRVEVESASIDSFFDSNLIISVPDDYPMPITLKSGSVLSKLIGKKKAIDTKGALVSLILVDEQEYMEKQIGWENQVLTASNKLVRLIEEVSLEIALSKAVFIISDFFSDAQVALYQTSPEKPILEKKHQSEKITIYPEKITLNDIYLGSRTNLWIPGQRMACDMHKLARSKGVAYLGSTALGPGKSTSAYLVIANTRSSVPKHFEKTIEMFGSVLSSILQYFILVSALRKQLEKKKGFEAVNKDFLENTYDCVIELNDQFQIISLNENAANLLGYSVSDTIGQPIDILFAGVEGIGKILEEVKILKRIHDFNLVRIHNRAGTPTYANAKIIPIVEPREAYLVILQPMDEYEELRVRVETLEKHAKLGEVTAVFAHDVRNPISGISMGAQILARKFANDEQAADITSRMLQDCDRLTYQMESILAYSKTAEPKLGQLNIAFLIDRVIGRMKPKLLKYGITEFLQKPDEIPVIMADSKSLDRVFTNLIGNAIDAMSSNGGTLAIHINENDEILNHPQVEVKIIDSGPGIPEDVRGKIFEPFVTTKKSGTGLGLAICKKIITEHRGNITVSSFEGGGTVFTVFLPIKQGE